MTTVDFITELFCRVDDAMTNCPKHTQASLHPSIRSSHHRYALCAEEMRTAYFLEMVDSRL